ncbi:MAG: SsrA-binding protein SmpB [Candidatus Pacebacteria bacterium]|nr:SsrA-binding protein SmpB [Candidatus Paceibacterota bacterium]
MEPIVNKKARFDYEILSTYEAGLSLLGHEAKAVTVGKASIIGSFAKIYNNTAWLVGATIGPYQQKNTAPGYDPTRARALLLNKKEIKELLGATQQKGLTLVPLKLYNNHGKIKLELGLAKSKTKGDKRETIKKRDTQRSASRGIE